jgi:uncharacterized membrane protein YcaP (DUF421 family)
MSAEVIPLDWNRMFFGDQPPLFMLEIVVRTILIYGFTVLMLRAMGKRGKREMSAFEYVVIIALGSATGDSMFYPDVPIIYAWLVIVVIVVLNRLVSVLQFKHPLIHRYVEGEPTLLIHEGKLLAHNLFKERMSKDELFSMLREQGHVDTGSISLAYLELSGELGVILADDVKSKSFTRVSTLRDDSKALAT